MKTSRAKNLEVRTSQSNARSSTRSGARSLHSRSLSASALLATAMLLLALAPFGNAACADTISSRQWHAQWATISSSLATSLGAPTENAARAQSAEMWRWMQNRVASFTAPQNLTPQQIGALLDEWRATQRGQISWKNAASIARNKSCVFDFAQTTEHAKSSTRFQTLALSSALSAFLNSVPLQTSPLFAAKSRALSAFSLPFPIAAALNGVRTNHFDE